ncbi:hypothetical protein LCGC14_1340390 [marine sediment metagenome]|uniref:Uncharacterized protein n=1 Tax=marine sediment metagenome TaxID=412755 RepID=A0A0F9KEN5_9ZZZZ
MSRAKNRARAEAGGRFVNTHEPRMARRYVCANCHKSGHFIKVGEYYFHDHCPKTMVPFTEAELNR